MDPRERYADPIETVRLAQDGHQATMWTALPGIVVSFDPVAVTVSVQPAIQGKLTAPDGSHKAVTMPLLPDVPVCFPRGGGCTLTFPIAAGDECLVVFASRCIDGWWQQGGVSPQLDARMHDLSDGFAIIGPQSQAHRIGGISTSSAQLRSDDGSTMVDVVAGAITVTAAHVTINSADVNIVGASLKHNGINVGSDHRHKDVQPGTGLSGVPNG